MTGLRSRGDSSGRSERFHRPEVGGLVLAYEERREDAGEQFMDAADVRSVLAAQGDAQRNLMLDNVSGRIKLRDPHRSGRRLGAGVDVQVIEAVGVEPFELLGGSSGSSIATALFSASKFIQRTVGPDEDDVDASRWKYGRSRSISS
nr:hypothetical protein [Nocardia wallacei]